MARRKDSLKGLSSREGPLLACGCSSGKWEMGDGDGRGSDKKSHQWRFFSVWLELLRKTNGGVGGVDATAGASW
jgi:hypothetical protein